MCDICGKQHDMVEMTKADLAYYVMANGAQYLDMSSECFEHGLDYAYVTHWKVGGDEDNMFYLYRTNKCELIAWYGVNWRRGFKAVAVQ